MVKQKAQAEPVKNEMAVRVSMHVHNKYYGWIAQFIPKKKERTAYIEISCENNGKYNSISDELVFDFNMPINSVTVLIDTRIVELKKMLSYISE